MFSAEPKRWTKVNAMASGTVLGRLYPKGFNQTALRLQGQLVIVSHKQLRPYHRGHELWHRVFRLRMSGP